MKTIKKILLRLFWLIVLCFALAGSIPGMILLGGKRVNDALDKIIEKLY